MDGDDAHGMTDLRDEPASATGRDGTFDLGWSLMRRVVAGEGWGGAVERMRERLAAKLRRAAFPTLETSAAGFALPPAWRQSLQSSTPRVLDILPTEPRPDLGGVQTQFALRFAHETRRRTGALLYPWRGGYRLELKQPRRGAPQRLAVRWRELPEAQLSLVLRQITDELGMQILHVEQPLGLPFDTLLTWPDRLVLSLHDFGLFCPRPHLLERPHLRFCDYCHDDARCTSCLRHDMAVEPGFQSDRRRLAHRLLLRADALVFPSEFLRRTFRELFADLDPHRCRVISPPSPRSAGRRGSRPSDTRRIAFVGSVQPHKGALVFERLVRQWREAAADGRPAVQWHVFGGGDAEILGRLRELGVQVHGYYRSGSLGRKLNAARIDLALALSVWPETYCMVIDECLHAEVPVVAFDLGAPGDRLRELDAGILVPPDAGAGGVADAIVRASGRGAATVSGHAELPTAKGAAADFEALYGELLDPGSGSAGSSSSK